MLSYDQSWAAVVMQESQNHTDPKKESESQTGQKKKEIKIYIFLLLSCNLPAEGS